MIRYCVVDDHQIVRDGLAAMALREEDLELVGSSSLLAEAADLLTGTKPDVLLLDLQFNGESSIQTCSALTQAFPEVKVLLFSAYGNSELLRQSVQAGAAGYMLKDTDTSKIPEILREVIRSGHYFDSRLSGPLLRESFGQSLSEAFTERELRIVSEIARGSNNYDIAELSNISPHTVKFHISAMLKRYKLQRRSELVHLAMSMHLLD